MSKLLLFFLLGLASSQLLFDAQENNEIEVAEGNEFTVTMKGNPTTGYIWVLMNSDEVEGFLQATNLDDNQSGEFEAPDPSTGLVGAGGVYKFTFNALKSDEEAKDLKFAYVRPWEAQKNDEPTLVVKVNISKE